MDKPLIGIADDDVATRVLFQRTLEREGFEIRLATNGGEAVGLVDREDLGVLLLDMQMPVLDGLQALREIRAGERGRTLPIILVTGLDDVTDRVRGLDAGADDYLVKPVFPAELVARVRAHLRGQSAWTEELERGRQTRRRLAAMLEALPRDVALGHLAATLVERLPEVIDVEAVAILHSARGTVRSIAASGSLRSSFPPGRLLPKPLAREVAHQADLGPWIDTASGYLVVSGTPVETAFVPFRLGGMAKPLGCLVFGQRAADSAWPIAHRLPDLVDATEFIVGVLRPAVERAETADTAINRLKRIIARREFAIHLQPIVRLDSGVLVAVEALTRFDDDVPPDVRFAEAASLGLGAALERTAVEAAIEATRALPAEIALSVNLSADVLRNEPALVDILAGARRPVIVELTEHEPVDDYDAVRAALVRLGPGVRLAIDDAGSGYASLRHIFALQPAFVKLDIEWVRGIDGDPVRRALVSGLTYFASETGAELIAEGIETEAERRALQALHVDLGQGFLLGRPEAPSATPG